MARRRLWLGALALAGGLLAGAGAHGPAAQEPLCDPAVPASEDTQYGYRERGDRCEGIYDRTPVSGATLSIASFTRGDVKYELIDTPLEVTWPSELEQPVRLRAKPVRRDVFYQMDTVQPAAVTSFAWPTAFLERYGIKELAILGWSMVPLRGEELPVHLPLAVHQGVPPADGEGYNLLVVPGVELRKLSVAIDHLDETGEVDDAPLKATELGWGFYPPDTGVPIPLPDLAQPGIYHVTLIAERLSDGIELPAQFWFYHPAG